jgi:hypothetical protein
VPRSITDGSTPVSSSILNGPLPSTFAWTTIALWVKIEGHLDHSRRCRGFRHQPKAAKGGQPKKR